MEQRIIELEKKAAFQDQAIEDLHEILVDQQKRIEQLEKQLANFIAQINSGDLVRKIDDEEAPPHY